MFIFEVIILYFDWKLGPNPPVYATIPLCTNQLSIQSDQATWYKQDVIRSISLPDMGIYFPVVPVHMADCQSIKQCKKLTPVTKAPGFVYSQIKCWLCTSQCESCRDTPQVDPRNSYKENVYIYESLPYHELSLSESTPKRSIFLRLVISEWCRCCQNGL